MATKLTASAVSLRGSFMNATQCSFVRQFFGVVVAALVPVVLTAFVSMPFNLGGHPGEERAATMPTQTHIT